MTTIEASTTTAPAVRTEPSTQLPAPRTAPVRPRAAWIDVTDPRTGRLGVEMRWWLPTATSLAGAA